MSMTNLCNTIKTLNSRRLVSCRDMDLVLTYLSQLGKAIQKISKSVPGARCLTVEGTWIDQITKENVNGGKQERSHPW